MSGREQPSGAPVVSPAGAAAPTWQRRTRIALFAGLVLMFLAWSLITPLGGSPDEPAHLQEGYATITGQTFNSSAVDQVPASLAEIAAGCYAFLPAKSANCFQPDWAARGKVGVRSSAAGYPPVFYALTAWPLFLPEPFGAYAARFIASLLTAAVAVAVVAGAARLTRARWARFGILAALTPQVAWFGGMYNPQGLETFGVAAVTLWTAVRLTKLAEGDGPTRRARTGFIVLVAVVCLCRPLSFVLVPIVMALAAGWVWARQGTVHFSRQTLTADGQRLAAAYCAASVLAGAAWFAFDRARPWVSGDTKAPAAAQPLPRASLLGGLHRALDLVSNTTLQAVGVFGWVDTPLPLIILVLLFAFAMLPILVSTLVGSPRWAVLAILFSAIAIAMALVVTSFETGGTPFWQARYGWPLVAALCLLAVAAIASAVPVEIRVWPLVGLWTGLQPVAWAYVWWRFAHGIPTAGAAKDLGTWHTPTPVWLVLLLLLAGLGLTLAGLDRVPRLRAGVAR